MKKFVLAVITFISIFALSGCGGSGEPPIDQILINGKIFTANPNESFAEAVAIRGDKIVSVGKKSDIELMATATTKVVDLNGGFLMPGMIDSHVHVVNGGYFSTSALIPRTVDTIADLSAYAKEVLSSGLGLVGDVLRIRGVRYSFWNRLPELSAVFDAAPFDTVPVVLAGGDAHSGFGNSAALKRAGITKDFIVGLPPEQRQYYGHTDDFTPNGFVAERGWDRLASIVPPVSTEKLAIGAKAGVDYMNSFGITAWLDPMVNAQPARPMFSITPTVDDLGVLPAYEAIAKQGNLTAHVVGMQLVNARSGPEALDVVDTIQRRFSNVPNLKLSGIKILADGVSEAPSRTAAISLPYKSTGTYGLLEIDNPEKFSQLAIAADKRGLQIHVHAIGDRAVTTALDGIAAARKSNGTSGPIHTLTHIEFLRKSDVNRFHDLRVAAAMQLLWAEDKNPDVDDSLQPSYPAGTLYRAKALISGASDWGVSTPNPFAAIATAVTRQPPSERMPIEAMLLAYTRNAAQVLGMGDSIGSIEPGKQADFAILDRNVLEIPEDQIQSTKVLWTMFGGKIVYESNKK